MAKAHPNITVAGVDLDHDAISAAAETPNGPGWLIE
jgi:hypothetical protein